MHTFFIVEHHKHPEMKRSFIHELLFTTADLYDVMNYLHDIRCDRYEPGVEPRRFACYVTEATAFHQERILKKLTGSGRPEAGSQITALGARVGQEIAFFDEILQDFYRQLMLQRFNIPPAGLDCMPTRNIWGAQYGNPQQKSIPASRNIQLQGHRGEDLTRAYLHARKNKQSSLPGSTPSQKK